MLTQTSTGFNLIEVRDNRPMVSSLKVAELFGRRHDNVLQTIRQELAKEISLLELKESEATNSRGKKIPVFWLDERQALTVMPFLGGDTAREGQRKLVDAYLAYRDAFNNPSRANLVRAKRDACKVLTDSILEHRTEIGKSTVAHNYMAEQKLCNWVVGGKFQALDEKDLEDSEVELLRLIRERNAALIVAGIEYEERKRRLNAYGTQKRVRLALT